MIFQEGGKIMAEIELRSKEDFLDLIDEICESKGIQKSQLEKEAGISKGMIARWRKNNQIPSLRNTMKISQLLDIKIIFRTSEPEDNSGLKEEIISSLLDEDTLLMAAMIKILKSEIASSNKEKLYKILKAFV